MSAAPRTPIRTISDIPGVYAGGQRCGIKKNGGKDLAFLYVPHATAAAGVATKNAFAAPCITYVREVLAGGVVKAVVINAGNANAATGAAGLQDARRTAELAAGYLNLQPQEVAVASTGIIGVPLPMDCIERGLGELLADPKQLNGRAAAEAILTTDTCVKEVFYERNIGSTPVTVGGFAKGSGMIAPNMATMLGFLAVDAAVEQPLLQEMLQEAVNNSFNMVSVDTDTSTNDLVLLFASGQSEVDCTNSDQCEALFELINDACISLAKQIARDGEGASKLLEVAVQGAATDRDAQRIAKSIVDSPLVKTAVHGEDPNWGRVIMAVGKVEGVTLDPERVVVSFGETTVFCKGAPSGAPRETVKKQLQGEEVCIRIDLQLGTGSAVAWGCDLTKGYIDINVDYN